MKATPNSVPARSANLPVAQRDHMQGAPDAEFLLLEYGDYQCPYCGEAYPLIKDLQRQLSDRLCFAFRNFPLRSMHPSAQRAAEAAEAAGSQGYFWAMHDMLFENQDALEDDDLAGYASALRLDSQLFVREAFGGVHTARVREDFRLGVRGGVNGTPTFFINGQRYVGPISVDGLLNAFLSIPRAR